VLGSTASASNDLVMQLLVLQAAMI